VVKSMARSQIGTLKRSSIEVACSCLTAALLPWAPVALTLTRQRQSPVYSALRLGKNICAAWIFCAPLATRRGSGHSRETVMAAGGARAAAHPDQRFRSYPHCRRRRTANGWPGGPGNLLCRPGQGWTGTPGSMP
jgi:hypothetical protein